MEEQREGDALVPVLDEQGFGVFPRPKKVSRNPSSVASTSRSSFSNRASSMMKRRMSGTSASFASNDPRFHRPARPEFALP